MQNEAQQRVTEHAKLFTVDGRQVLAFLSRNDADPLAIILQVWSAAHDESLRAVIQTEDEGDVLGEVFADLNDEIIPVLMDECGLSAAIAEIENG